MAKKTVSKKVESDKRFTTDEIFALLRNSDKFSIEVKGKVLNFADGMVQAMWNMQDNPKKYMHLINFPDNWQEGHNAIVKKYQEAILIEESK
jgi:hypothetical protein